MNAFIKTTHTSKLGITKKNNLQIKIFNLLSYGHFLLPAVDRRFQIFCVGLPRSGTHSLAHLFEPFYAAKHEPLKQLTVANIIDWTNGKHSDFKMRSILANRDKYLKLELESSHFLHHVIELLVDIFPKAKFILTIREPVSWLVSEVNQNYTSRNSDFWGTLQNFRYGCYGNEYINKSLIDIPNVYPISNYFSYWKDHINKIIDNVPAERLLVIDTFEITNSLNEIASFTGSNQDNFTQEKSWSGKRKSELDLYDLLEKSQVLSQAEEHCGDFIQEKVPFLSKHCSFLQ
ncbi:MAG: sulfotransferase [Pleurocapsa sp.]